MRRGRTPRSRPATGRRLPRPKLVRGTREIIREHLREAEMNIKHDLARAWRVIPTSAQRLMYDNKRSITPEHVHAVIKLLQLDEFDALELYTTAAIEDGWRIKPPEGP